MGVEPKLVVKPPKSSIFNRVLEPYLNHPFWGTIIFGNTHMENMAFFTGLCTYYTLDLTPAPRMPVANEDLKSGFPSKNIIIPVVTGILGGE